MSQKCAGIYLYPSPRTTCLAMRLVNGHGVRPQELGKRCLAKRVQGVTCDRRPEHLHACFGMRLVDEHGMRPPVIWSKVFKVSVCGDRPVSTAQYIPLLLWACVCATDMDMCRPNMFS